MKYLKFIGLILTLVVTTAANSGIAMAAPPKPVGWTPISQGATRSVGSLIGDNGSSVTSCATSTRNLLTFTGDFTGYREPDGSVHSANKAVVINAKNGQFLWGASSVNGWVQSSHCALGKIFFGGSFTTFNGQPRNRVAALSASSLALTSWQPSTAGTVWSIDTEGSDVFLATGNQVKRVTTSGTQVWERGFDCAVRTVLPIGARVYVGGFFDHILRPGTTAKSARGLAVLSLASGSPYSNQPAGSIPNDTQCGWSGANPLSLAYDSNRGRVVACEGGTQNKVRSVSISTGDQMWIRSIDGDGQTCVFVRGYIFVGFHRNQPLHHNYGAMGAVLNGWTGAQAIWQPSPDFVGAGDNDDKRNNGIIGATYDKALDKLWVTGGFNSVDDLSRPKMAGFTVDPGQ
jgi:hypothetical protein